MNPRKSPARSPRSRHSGIPGVTWHDKRNAWQARTDVNGTQHYIGLFDAPIDAAIALIHFHMKRNPSLARLLRTLAEKSPPKAALFLSTVKPQK